MGLAENLLQGFAGAAGANDVVNRIQNKKDDRKATAHEELEAQSHAIFDDVKQLQKRRASLDRTSPSYATDLAGIDASLQQHMAAFHDLYHPEKNPGALAHLGAFIKSHTLKDQPANVPATPAEAKQSMAQLQASAAGPGVTPPPAQAPTNPILVKRQQMKDAGYTDEEIAHAEHRGTPKTEGGTTTPPKTTSDERRRKDYEEFKKTHPEYKGTFERWNAEQSHLPRATTPKAPGAPKLTPAQNHAQIGYIDALKLSDVADQVAKNPNDAVNQKRLAVALERVSAGRFTTQALDYIVKSGWGNTIEQWANNPSTGALPSDVIRQLVDGAHQNLSASERVLKRADELAPKIPSTPGEAKKKAAATKGGGGQAEYIYAKDPQGNIHRNKKGAALPQGWTLTDAPTN